MIERSGLCQIKALNLLFSKNNATPILMAPALYISVAWQGYRGDQKKKKNKQNLSKPRKPKAEPGHYIDKKS